MTAELKQSHKDQLSKWIDSSKTHTFTLLFKASRDGCTAQSFHNLCNNKGPTVTIFYNTNRSVYGGYTSVSWHSNGSYTNDNNAFLFKLEYNGCLQPVKMPKLQNNNKSIYGHASHGPTFGEGHDLLSFTHTVKWSGSYFTMDAGGQFGNAYDIQGQNSTTITNGHLNVVDLEVYRVEERGKQLQKPWIRNIDWTPSFLEDIKETVENYKPLPGLDLPQAKILMVGQVGAGKSSYFNTINSIFRGYISGQANAGSAEHSLTTTYRMYQVRTGSAGKPLNFRLCDTRGLEEDQGLDDHEVGYLLDGHMPDRYKFNTAVPLSPDTLGFIKNPKLADKIHCVVFVVDVSTIDVISENVLERIKSMQIRMNQRGIPQIVLLTKIDRISEDIADGISRVFFSPAMKQSVDNVAQVMGLPRSHIFPVKNYECEVEPDDNTNLLSLLSLRHILHLVDDFLYNKLDEVEAGKLQQLKMKE